MNTRAELDAFFDRVPEHVLTVARPGVLRVHRRPRLRRRDRGVLQGGPRRASSCARSRRSTGSRGSASATASARRTSSPRSARCAARSTSSTPAQVAALASLGDDEELARRRRERTRAARARARGASCARHGLRAAPAPAVGNFVYVDVGEDARPLFERLLREGVIVRPLARLRRARRDPGHGRHARRERVPRSRRSRDACVTAATA